MNIDKVLATWCLFYTNYKQAHLLCLLREFFYASLTFWLSLLNLKLIKIFENQQLQSLIGQKMGYLAFCFILILGAIALYWHFFFNSLKVGCDITSPPWIKHRTLFFLSLFLLLTSTLGEQRYGFFLTLPFPVEWVELSSKGLVLVTLFLFYLSAFTTFFAFGKVIKEGLKSVGLDLRTVVKATLTTLAETVVVCVMGTLLLLTLGYSLTHAITGMGFAGFSLLTALLAVVSCPLAIREKGWFPLFSLLAISSPRLHTFYVRAFSLLSRFRFPALISGVRFFSSTEGIDLTLVMAAAIILGIFFMVEVVWHLTFLSEKKSVLQVAVMVGRKFILQALWVSAFFLVIWMVSPYFWTYFLPLLVDGGIKIVNLCERLFLQHLIMIVDLYERLLLRYFVMIGGQSALTEQQPMVLRMESTPPRLEKPAGGSGSFASPVEEGQRSDSLETPPSPSALQERQSVGSSQGHGRSGTSESGQRLMRRLVPVQGEGSPGLRPPTPRSDLHPVAGREGRAEMATPQYGGSQPSPSFPVTPGQTTPFISRGESSVPFSYFSHFPNNLGGRPFSMSPSYRCQLPSWLTPAPEQNTPNQVGPLPQQFYPAQQGEIVVAPQQPAGRPGHFTDPAQQAAGGPAGVAVSPTLQENPLLQVNPPRPAGQPSAGQLVAPADATNFLLKVDADMRDIIHRLNLFLHPNHPNRDSNLLALRQIVENAGGPAGVAVPSTLQENPPLLENAGGPAGVAVLPTLQENPPLQVTPPRPAGQPSADQQVAPADAASVLLQVNIDMERIIHHLGLLLDPNNANRDANLLALHQIVERKIFLFREQGQRTGVLPDYQKFLELYHLLVTLANYTFENYNYRPDGNPTFLGGGEMEQREPLSRENYIFLKARLARLSQDATELISLKIEQDTEGNHRFNGAAREHLAQHPEITPYRRGNQPGEVRPGRLSTTLFHYGKGNPHTKVVLAMKFMLRKVLDQASRIR